MKTPAPQFLSLNNAAKKILHYLRGFEEFKQVQTLVTGDLALWNHFPGMGFLIFLGDGFDDRVEELPSGAPDLLKLGLSLMHPNSFRQQLNFFQIDYSIEGIQSAVSIQFLPKEILPYIPQEILTIAETRKKHTDDLPYISALDLLVYMVNYDMSVETREPYKDARTISQFLEHLQSKGPVISSPQQRKSLASGLN
ncbi:uncharacterized protein N7479_005079 [Penicillium vulpinum]|uniref:uncharacterized protein n=1 Tax=Penicillium vulpinum TaxID=29845 RepID=UPI002549A333|nr:uncharacterized protein N7479_005079 [Penicillium vulpinum]KAJ5965203.1 hypothetical protein N7479_005079 [Penicillium vulpinum]